MLIFSNAFKIAKWATCVPRVYRFAPVFVCCLTFAFARFGQLRNSRYKTKQDREQSAFECYKAQDVSILRSVYLFAFILQAMSHVILLVYAHSELSTALARAVLQSYWNSKHDTIDQTADAFSSDMAIAFTTWFISNMYSIWDLRCFGYIKTRDGLICALSVVAGHLLVGPGATWLDCGIGERELSLAYKGIESVDNRLMSRLLSSERKVLLWKNCSQCIRN